MIAKKEIETFRCPFDYIRWFKTHLESTRNHDRATYSRALQHKGFFKIFYEELFPLYNLLKNKQGQWNNSLFRNVLGSQSYDVEVQNHSLNYLEIGTTDFDDGELLRMQKSLAGETVSLICKIKRDAKGKPISVKNEMRSTEDFLQEIKNSIAQLITKKAAKKYPSNIGLIVYYRDADIHYEQKDINQLKSTVMALETWRNTFEVIYLVGPKGKNVVEIMK